MAEHDLDLPLLRPTRRRPVRTGEAAPAAGGAATAWPSGEAAALSADPAAVMRAAGAEPPPPARGAGDDVTRGPGGPAPEAIAERVMTWLRRDLRVERERRGRG